MPDSAPPELDPVTFEVLNHRLLSISEEMGIQYMRCSGSNVLITGNDAASAIMNADGALVAVGPYIVTQGNVLPLIVQATIDAAKLHGDFANGDIYICNDPYLGAIHAPDFATVSPVFHEGELVAWLGASGHQLDTGGMDPGGFSVKAVDIHQEGLRMPPVKLVDRGVVRTDAVIDRRHADVDAQVLIDITHLQQILLNLVANARDAGPPGGVITLSAEVVDTARCHLLDDPAHTPHVAISVTDEGPGIPSAIATRIWEPFFSSKQLSNDSGSGLGLSTVHGLVHQHGGHVAVSHGPTGGTTFTVYLPVHE